MALVTFTAGERLFAADLNDNFQETRTAANIITGTFDAGRIPNLDASKINAGTLAAALFPAGNVLQVSNERFTARQDIATTTFTATAITGSITPQFTGSKILVIAYVNVRGETGDSQNDVATDTRLLRGGTVIAETREHHRPGTGNFATGHHVLAVLDSPATGSSVTYSVQARVADLGGRSININRDAGSSSLLLMEVR